MNLKSLINRPEFFKRSYAQSGEDIIVDYILRQLLRISEPTYLDIGAHHARELSNTFRFYEQGGKGVCVEPNPELCSNLKRIRPRDVCLNLGIAEKDENSADFYVFDPPTMSTFSRDERESYLGKGYRLVRVIKVDLININSLVSKYFHRPPNFVSLDTEGFDLSILEKWNFKKHRPEVVCVETVEHASEAKIPRIGILMAENGYIPYADTYINTIYVDRISFAARSR